MLFSFILHKEKNNTSEPEMWDLWFVGMLVRSESVFWWKVAVCFRLWAKPDFLHQDCKGTPYHHKKITIVFFSGCIVRRLIALNASPLIAVKINITFTETENLLCNKFWIFPFCTVPSYNDDYYTPHIRMTRTNKQRTKAYQTLV